MKKKIKSLFDKILSQIKKEEQEKHMVYVYNKPSAQYRLPTIKIVGNLDKEDIDEIRDFVIEHIVDEYFKNVPCHVFRFKGDTFIRLKNEDKVCCDKTTEIPFINIHKYDAYNTMVLEQQRLEQKYRPIAKTFVDEFRRSNSKYKS